MCEGQNGEYAYLFNGLVHRGSRFGRFGSKLENKVASNVLQFSNSLKQWVMFEQPENLSSNLFNINFKQFYSSLFEND